MKSVSHQVDFCVVGGGMAGLCTALAAARRGIKVALMHDRPVLGGNASSEIRMCICGAHGKDNRETGILEEIELENIRRNPLHSYALWDSVLYDKAVQEKNLLLIMNCSCNEVAVSDGEIKSVTGWQLTTETRHTVHAKLFADCTGDGTMGAMAGADFRIGREAASEFNETIPPPVADKKTMGISCLIQVRETDRPQTFIPPTWANVYNSDEELLSRGHDFKTTNFWWIELGGEQDSIHDTEELKHELLKIAFGVWDHIKNRGNHGADNWTLDWVGFLPGKRESRRFLGSHILTQNDIEAGGKFDDLVAYGGWSMDDHPPAGMYYTGKPTINHPAPSPYGIPYRSLYSRNISNLFFAGRNISATHAAMSSTRVMRTCSIMGQAVGTAAALALKNGLTPDGVSGKMHELQQQLMDDDCYLPGFVREIPAISKLAKLTASGGSPAVLRNGVDRPVGDVENAWTACDGAWVEYDFGKDEDVKSVRLVFDSDLNRGTHNMPWVFPLDLKPKSFPHGMVKGFTLEYMRDGSSEWELIYDCPDNHKRLVRIPVDRKARKVRLTIRSGHGADRMRIFAFDCC